jgi:hypothetical protein
MSLEVRNMSGKFKIHKIKFWVLCDGACSSTAQITPCCRSCDVYCYGLNIKACLIHVHEEVQISQLRECVFHSTRRSSWQNLPCTYKRNMEVCLRNHYCRGKAMCLTYSECVTVNLFIQHAIRMSHIMLFSLACQSLPNKRHDFRESLFKLITVFIFSTTYVWNIFHSK